MGENNQGGQKRVCLSSLTFLNFHVNPISGLPATEEGKMRLINVVMQLRSTPSPPPFHYYLTNLTLPDPPRQRPPIRVQRRATSTSPRTWANRPFPKGC